MNVLLVNDDGYFAEGISILYDLLNKKHNVVIVAPKTVMSAKSVSIIVDRDVEVKRVNEHTYMMDACPADCVAFGLSSLSIKFDLVVSGCNHGLNVSYDTMYSGTIGACLQALTFRVPALAISCENNFDIVKENLDKVIQYIEKNKLLSTEYLLNINFPVGEKVDNIKLTHIYYRKENTFYVHNGNDMYRALRNINDKNCVDVDSDVYAVYHNIISITKISKTSDIF